MGATRLHDSRPVVIVIGCDDLGSAIARGLHGAGAAVVLIDAADPPWARRGMSYTDAWYVGGATLEAVDACFCGSVRSLPAVLARGDMIAATTWSWEGVATALMPIAVVETRSGCSLALARTRPDVLQHVLTIGVRTTQVSGWRADVVIADAARADRVALRAVCDTRVPCAKRVQLDAPQSGRFGTRHQIAERITAGDVLGKLGSFTVIAPASGALVGLSARGARVATGQTLVEIDPSGDAAQCFRIAPEAHAIAARVTAAIRTATGTLRRPGPPVVAEAALVTA